MSSEERYIFLVEWFDNTASIVKQYHFLYYLSDKSIEMVIMIKI